MDAEGVDFSQILGAFCSLCAREPLRHDHIRLYCTQSNFPLIKVLHPSIIYTCLSCEGAYPSMHWARGWIHSVYYRADR